MPKDPFRTPPHRGKQGLASVKASRPSARPSQKVKAATGGVSPGTRGGKSQGSLKGPRTSVDTHKGAKRAMPKARTGASLKRGRGRGR
jgi:hypothetical protein